jgi:integrase
MSSYFKKGKGWRYDFTLKGTRYTETWFKTKKEAKLAEAKKREDILKPKAEAPTDTDFLTLINRRLDHVKAYNSASYYRDCCYMAKRWTRLWGTLKCSEITTDMIEKFILKRNKVSSFTANMEIRALRACFNFGKKKKMLAHNPMDGIDFLPVEKRIKYVPPLEDIAKVLQSADQDNQNYLFAIAETMGRVGEINNLTWKDVNLDDRYVILYTRKKKGGHLTPRKVPMTARLHGILSKLFNERDKEIPWVFWHRFFDRKNKTWKTGPYIYRKRLMKSLCKKAGVKYFSYHALRHAGASILDNNSVPIGSIQKILGHENRTTTEIYLHSLGKSEREAIDTLERVTNFSHTDSHTKQKGLATCIASP